MSTPTTTGGHALEHAMLSKPPVNIPNKQGLVYKQELVLKRDPKTETLKILWWFLPDDDRDPHNHPWDFVSQIKSGGYSERRWTQNVDGTYSVSDHAYRAGDTNVVPKGVFHMVTAVEPDTTTFLTCGPATENNEWWYLDSATLKTYKAEADPGFRERLKLANPWMK